MDKIERKIISYCVKCFRIERENGWTDEAIGSDNIRKKAGRICRCCRTTAQAD
jgi:hypothetical protein